MKIITNTKHAITDMSDLYSNWRIHRSISINQIIICSDNINQMKSPGCDINHLKYLYNDACNSKFLSKNTKSSCNNISNYFKNLKY